MKFRICACFVQPSSLQSFDIHKNDLDTHIQMHQHTQANYQPKFDVCSIWHIGSVANVLK